jgi:hypothetical protein
MPFDPSRMTILTQAAAGLGSWRIWHYVVPDNDSIADVTAPAYFHPMATALTPGSMVYVLGSTYIAQLALSRLEAGWTGFVMCHKPLPKGAHPPPLQSPPMGSSPGHVNAATNVGGKRAG